jgi:hypothetical protein
LQHSRLLGVLVERLLQTNSSRTLLYAAHPLLP